MININTNYKALLEGRMSKAEFLRQARQGLPGYITNTTSFDDAVKILRHKSLLSEELVYQNKADKFPLEQVQNGTRYELEKMEVPDVLKPGPAELQKARKTAIDNLCKDPLYYVYKLAGSDYKTVEKNEKEVEKDDKMKKVTLKEGQEQDASALFLQFYTKYKDGKYQVLNKETGEKEEGKPLEPTTSGNRAVKAVRRMTGNARWRPSRQDLQNISQTGKYEMTYMERNGEPSFGQRFISGPAVRGVRGQISEKNVEEGSAYEKPRSAEEKEGDRIFEQIYCQLVSIYQKKGDSSQTTKVKLANKALEAARQKTNNPGYTPSKLIRNNYKLRYDWSKQALDAVSWMPNTDTTPNIVSDPVKTLEESKNKAVLRETIVGLIGQILNEAATTNLAQLSDENASIAELPGIINTLENIVTEIESFWTKELQKIQGAFDSLGNIKNEDGISIGYKFVEPVLDSLKRDIEPVLSKITFDNLKLPEAPAPDQTQITDPNAMPEVPEKETVFSPASKDGEPLQESRKRRYTA